MGEDANAQAETLLRQIARAGGDAQALDRGRVEALFGLRTREACREYDDPHQGHVHACDYLPAQEQTGPTRFIMYETARLGPGRMTGGAIRWEIDPGGFCLKGRTIEQALGVKAEHARMPVMADLLAFADPKQVNSLASYDFTLLKHPGEGRQARFQDNYVAAVEEGGCVQRFSLSTYAPPDGQ